MKPITFLIAIFVGTALAKVGGAQQLRVEIPPVLINDVEQSAVATHSATPFLEPSSLLVVDVDVTKINVGQAAQWLFRQFGGPDDDAQTAESIATATGFVESLRGAGVSHVYFTASARAIFERGPVVVIPCENPAVVNGLASVLLQTVPKQCPQVIHVGEKLVLIGPQSAVDRVRQSEGTLRPDLLLPMKDADRLDHTAVFSLPAESREELIALWPDKMPDTSFLRFSPRETIRDIQRVVVSMRLPPEAEVLATIETTDADAAKRVRKTVEQVVAQSPEAKDLVTVEVDLFNVIVRATPEAITRVAKTASAPMKENAARQNTITNMKQVGLAMHNYFAVNNHLPPRCLVDRDGNPLLSWRVTILPYIEQLAMHRQFHLDEAWDSKHNSEFHRVLIPTFCTGRGKEPWKSTIRVPVYPGSLWDGDGAPRTFRDVKDGTSNTIAAIDAPDDAAVEWSNPEPWVLSEDDPASDVFGDRDEVTVLFLDGFVRVFKKNDLPNEKLKAMLTIDGGELNE